MRNSTATVTFPPEARRAALASASEQAIMSTRPWTTSGGKVWVSETVVVVLLVVVVVVVVVGVGEAAAAAAAAAGAKGTAAVSAGAGAAAAAAAAGAAGAAAVSAAGAATTAATFFLLEIMQTKKSASFNWHDSKVTSSFRMVPE